MRYQHVCIESLAYVLPPHVVTSEELESRLAPVYQRLRLPPGRLELISGIRQRRFFPAGTSIGQVSAQCASRALAASGLDVRHIGALVHGSVCRDYLEPATACGVHHALGLPAECLIFDLSNACLGLLTGVIQIANMIELGQIPAGIVVGTECGRELVENTVDRLNTDVNMGRRDVKQFIASLTIGSGSAAILLCDRELSRTQNRLEGAVVLAHTQEQSLCRSDGLQQFMSTDSEQLLVAGVETAVRTFSNFLDELQWQRHDVDKTICHQVGSAHRRELFSALGLSVELDYSTFPVLGNTGAAALPLTMALAAESGRLHPTDRIALMGIGSGINCQMLGVRWERSLVGGEPHDAPMRIRDAPTLAEANGAR